jgi:hypothetical protein
VVGDPGLGYADALGAYAEAQAVQGEVPEKGGIEHCRGARLTALLAGRERSEDPVTFAADALGQLPLQFPKVKRLRDGERRRTEKNIHARLTRFGAGAGAGAVAGDEASTGRERGAEENDSRLHVADRALYGNVAAVVKKQGMTPWGCGVN